MFKGNDHSIDTGGIDTYIVPVGILGKKIIDDADGSGLILLGSILSDSQQLYGQAIPVSQSSCAAVPVGTYFLNLGKIGVYYLIEQGNNLLITSDCANTIPELQNTLTLKNFVWGNFGINRYLGNNTATLIGSNNDDYLDCSLYKMSFNANYG